MHLSFGIYVAYRNGLGIRFFNFVKPVEGKQTFVRLQQVSSLCRGCASIPIFLIGVHPPFAPSIHDQRLRMSIGGNLLKSPIVQDRFSHYKP